MLIARGVEPGPRRVAFRSFFGFAGLPNPDNVYTNGAFATARDGLGKVSDFYARWGGAQELSNQIDSIMGDPLARQYLGEAKPYEDWIVQRMRDAAYNFEWGPGLHFNRPADRQQALDSALADIDRGLTGYMNKMGDLFRKASSAIAAREQQIAANAQKALETKQKEDEARQAALAKQEADDLLKIAVLKTAEAKEQKVQLVEQVDLVKAQTASLVDLSAAKKEAMIATGQISPLQAALGGSTSLMVGLAAAAGLGIYLYASKKRR